MATLYELREQYKRLLELANEVDSEAFENALEHLTESINEKAENIAYVLQEMKSDVDAIRREEKRLRDRRTALEKRHDRLKFYLQQELEEAGINSVKSPMFTVSLRNNAPKLVINNDENIPVEYQQVSFIVDKKRLKEDVKNGLEIDGVTLVQERSVQIR